VLTICDLTPLEHPEWFKPTFAMWYRLFLPLLVHRVRQVVTLSEQVRSKLLARFNLSQERVAAIPAGVNHTRFHPLYKPANKWRYILYVGSLEPRKNLSLLLRAWQMIENRYPDISLALVGVTGRVFRRFKLPDDIERVHFAGYVSEEDLPAFYAGAAAFVLPSFDEGFGLTVLEAMACGTPVLASNRGALPEVVGDAGILFDPNDPSALARNLSDCLTDSFLSRTLRQKGLERAGHFSWSSSAERIWKILRGINAA
jgi:glycosyltransferase involved in cell wall biosynthesis